MATEMDSTVETASILHHLKRRQAGFKARVAVKFIVGVPLTFLGPLVLGTIFWIVGGLLVGWHSWWWYFLGMTLLLVPLLYWQEARGSERLLVEAAGSGNPAAAGAFGAASLLTGDGSLMLGVLAAQPRAAAAGATEFFLAGPRQVIPAWRQVRLARQLRGANLDRAALLLARLLHEGHGVEPETLLRKGETAGQITRELAYLLFHDWIGAGTRHNKVWIDSEARAKLAQPA